MNTKFSILQTFGADLLVILIVRGKAGSDKTQQAAVAQNIINIITALQQINNGGTAAGLQALQTTINTSSSLDPGEVLLLQNLLLTLVQKGATILSLADGTILSDVETQLLNNIATAIIAEAQSYIPAVQANEAVAAAA